VSSPPVWIDARAILFLHDESLAMFGGARGLRDPGLFDSALMRPVNQHLYKPDSDIAELAAAYAFGLAKNHPFVDGNKRTAFLALGLFVALNGWRLETTQLDAIEMMLSLATGTLDESALANWIRERIQPANEFVAGA
jgi:death-on-curing protein